MATLGVAEREPRLADAAEQYVTKGFVLVKNLHQRRGTAFRAKVIGVRRSAARTIRPGSASRVTVTRATGSAPTCQFTRGVSRRWGR